MNKQILLDKISESTKLPVLPDMAIKVLELQNDPEVYPAKVQAVLGSDPVLAARLLQVSNSSMFPCRRKISDLGEALAMLGVNMSMSIAVGLVVVDSLRNHEDLHAGFDYQQFWRKSVLGAVAANEMYGVLKVASRGELFVASLMQDMGILVLLNIAGDKYLKLLNTARSHLDLVELENRVFGVDHAEVSQALLKAWGLPEKLQRAVGRSHALFGEETTFDLNDLDYGVAFSGVLSELWIAESSNPDTMQRTISDYLDRIGEDAYCNTVTSIVEAIPGANEVFNMTLLSSEQMANVA
jgi:HD-like signal output (HDOD) protein